MIADAYEAFLYDLDGVLYRGADPVPGAAESLTRLRSLGKGIAFVTNNSPYPAGSWLRRLATPTPAGRDVASRQPPCCRPRDPQGVRGISGSRRRVVGGRSGGRGELDAVDAVVVG
jgi:hypothetical protein